MALSHIFWPDGAPRDVLRAVFEAQPECVTIACPDGKVLAINPAGLVMIDARSHDQVHGQDSFGVVHRADRARVRKAHSAALATGEPQGPVEFRIRSLAGREMVVEARFAPLPADDDWAVGVLSITRDVTAQRQAEAALRESEAEHRHFVEVNNATFWTATPDGAITIASDAGARRLGIQQHLPDGRARAQAVHPDDIEHVRHVWRKVLDSGALFDVEYRLRVADGTYHWVHARAFARRDEHGRIVRWYGSTEDIQDRKAAEQRLIESEALNRSIIEASADCIKLLDLEGRLLFMNARGLKAMEIDSFEPLRGMFWWELWPSAQQPVVRLAVERALQNRVEEFAALCPTARGTEKWWSVVLSPVLNTGGQVTGLTAISRDVTEQRQSEEQVRWLANHDVLTKLPNRQALQDKLELLFATADGDGSKVGLILLDVDHFKEINDDLGHDAGDVVLRSIADRLRKLGSPVSCISRLGGDEFVVVVSAADGETPVRTVAEQLIEQLHEPVQHAGRTLESRGSFGVAVYPDHARTYSDLLKAADIALYMAKSLGRGGYSMFSPHMQRAVHQRIAVSDRVRQGLASDITPFYQPKLDLGSGELQGFEALMRIRQTNGRFQGPGAIASAFEDSELAVLLSERMLDCIMADMRRWLDRGVPFRKIAVNAAAPELRRGDFAKRLLERLERAGIAPSMLEIEVTESVFLGRRADVIDDALRILSRSGVSIALDDFGTGFASLSHIKRYPVDTLKIDRSFVSGLGSNADDAAIVRAVITLGRSLGMTVVAEGIETPEQAAFLQLAGCAVGQGYLLGRPMARARVPKFMDGLRQASAAWLPAGRSRRSAPPLSVVK